MLEALRAELERFGEANDAVNAEPQRRMLNITRDAGELSDDAGLASLSPRRRAR